MKRLVAVVVVAAACHRGGDARKAALIPDAAPLREVVVVERIAVTMAAWPESLGGPPEARSIGGRVNEELAQSGIFDIPRQPELVADAAPGTMRVRARVNVELAVERDGSTMRGAATVSLVWLDDDERIVPWSSHGCEGEVKAGADAGAQAMSLVECAVGDAARGLVDKELVRRGDATRVMAALESSDPSLRQVAFATIGERKLRDAVPRLLEMLKSSDVLERDGAIGALVALREPRAIKPLTEIAAFNDVDMMRRIIDAVGIIGGEEARSYLELVATGHDNESVRDLAKAALERLDRRARDGG